MYLNANFICVYLDTFTYIHMYTYLHIIQNLNSEDIKEGYKY